jgi:hypothetical protein
MSVSAPLLVVSGTQMVVYVLKGHDFSRAVRPEVSWALAPEGSLFYVFIPFSRIGD